MQRNYIANVTHALKSPIAAVKTLTETLCDVEDLDTTRTLQTALQSVGIVLADHIIVADDDYVSLADDGYLGGSYGL